MECEELLFLYVTRTHTHRHSGTPATGKGDTHRQTHILSLSRTHIRAYKNKLHLYEDWRWPPAHHIFSLSKQRQSRSRLAVGVVVVVGVEVAVVVAVG